MSNKVFINDKNIVECQVVGDQTPESVNSMGKRIATLLEELKSSGKPRLVLDDIVQIGKVSPAGRNAVVTLAKNLKYDRLAMVGKGGVIRFGANMLIRASGRHTRLRYFDNQDQASTWLLGK